MTILRRVQEKMGNFIAKQIVEEDASVRIKGAEPFLRAWILVTKREELCINCIVC